MTSINTFIRNIPNGEDFSSQKNGRKMQFWRILDDKKLLSCRSFTETKAKSKLISKRNGVNEIFEWDQFDGHKR